MPSQARFFLLCAFIAVGCGDVEIRPDSRSGADFERAGAQQLFLDKLTDDYVDGPMGDNTDWKYFKVTSKGILELTVFWDSHRDVDAVIDVRDRFGVLIDSRRHSGELEKDKMDLKVEPGTHFIRINAEKGASVYTIEAIFQRFDHNPDDDVIPEAVPVGGDPLGDLGEPIPDAVPIEAPEKRRPRARSPRAGARAPRPQAEAAPAGNAVSGTIIRMIPGTRSGTMLLTLNIGAGDGVSNGAKGYIIGHGGGRLGGGAIEVVKVSQKTSQAQTNLSSAKIGELRRVKVFVQ